MSSVREVRGEALRLTIACIPTLRLVLVKINSFLGAGTIPGSTWPASCAARRGKNSLDGNILGCTAKATTYVRGRE